MVHDSHRLGSAQQTRFQTIELKKPLLEFSLSSMRVETMVGRFSQRTIIRGGFAMTLTGIALLLLFLDQTSSLWLAVPGLLLVGFGAGSMLTASVNVVQSSVPEEDQGELSGLSRSVSNLGSSLGTAIAGAVLISALVSGITSLTNASTALPEDDKERIYSAMQGEVSVISDQQVAEVLEGQPQEVVEDTLAEGTIAPGPPPEARS